MKKIIFSLLFLSSLSVFGQETWNACNSTVNVIPQPSYDSTFVLSAPSRAALAKGMASWTPATSSGASYLVYTALLTQTGTDAPVATVLENTLGFTPTWEYVSSGQYYIQDSEDHVDFPLNKTYLYTPVSTENNAFSGARLLNGPSGLFLLISEGDGELSYVAQLVDIRVYP